MLRLSVRSHTFTTDYILYTVINNGGPYITDGEEEEGEEEPVILFQDQLVLPQLFFD